MLSNKNKLAYVDHNYHFKTRSGDFLRDVFKSKFSIKDFWIEKKLNQIKKILIYSIHFF